MNRQCNKEKAKNMSATSKGMVTRSGKELFPVGSARGKNSGNGKETFKAPRKQAAERKKSTNSQGLHVLRVRYKCIIYTIFYQ